jgi:hypothetical protein
VALPDDLERIHAAVSAAVDDGELVAAVIPTEPADGARAYVCAVEGPGGRRTWVVVDGGGAPVTAKRDVRDAVSIAALCEIAVEAAFPGDLDELRQQLVALRIAEAPEGIEEAEGAALALQHAIGAPPQVASPARLDAIGAAARRLERVLDPAAPSPFAAAMQGAPGVVEELSREVEAAYREPLE